MNRDTKNILVIFDGEHRIVSANDSFYQHFGYACKTIVRKPISFLLPDPLPELPFEFQHDPLFLEAANKEKYPVHGAICSIPRDPFPDQWVLIGSTALQKQEQAATPASRCLRCAGILHDINNVLSVAYATMSLIDLAQFPENMLARKKSLWKALHALNDLTSELERYIRDDGDNKTSCSVVDIVGSALGFAISGLPAVRTDFISTDNISRILADERSLFRAFLNIFTNACEAMKKEGRISVEITCGPSSLSGFAQNEAVQVKISDSGPGITIENVNSIFSPFLSSKGKVRGLGLYIAKNIIEQHGGTITAIQDSGRGAVFVVELPPYRGI